MRFCRCQLEEEEAPVVGTLHLSSAVAGCHYPSAAMVAAQCEKKILLLVLNDHISKPRALDPRLCSPAQYPWLECRVPAPGGR